MDRELFVNETATPRPSAAAANAHPRRPWQPSARQGHRPGHMFDKIAARPGLRTSLAFLVLAGALVACGARPAAAQTAAAQPTASGLLRPALAQVGEAVNGVDPRHWKAPGSVKSATLGDVEAIQRDLAGTLAGLLEQADAAPGSVPAQFAVYRNVDALYDTLLRIVETAELAAPNQEAASLESALSSLESARGQLGDTILAGAQTQQSQLIGLRRAISAAETAQRTPVKTTVIDDWSTPRHTEHRRATEHRRTSASRKPETHPKTPASAQKKPNPPSNPQ